MGTTGSDALYAEFYNRRRVEVDKRWKTWEPLCLLHARKHYTMVDGALASLRNLFVKRIHLMFDMGMRWQDIRRHPVDNPLVTEDIFEARLRNWKKSCLRFGTGVRADKSFEKMYAEDRKLGNRAQRQKESKRRKETA